MPTELQKVIQAHLDQKTPSPDYRAERRRKWLKELNELFVRLKDDLYAAGVPAGLIEMTATVVDDESLGRYDAPILSITFPAGRVTFEPITGVIIGGYGRVDVAGPANQSSPARLIALDADEDSLDEEHQVPFAQRQWVWKVFHDRGNPPLLGPLDIYALAQVMRLCLDDRSRMTFPHVN